LKAIVNKTAAETEIAPKTDAISGIKTIPIGSSIGTSIYTPKNANKSTTAQRITQTNAKIKGIDAMTKGIMPVTIVEVIVAKE
jgi:hypothetical protein